MTSEEVSSESLSKLYDDAQIIYDEIESSTLETNNNDFQKKIAKCICRLEHLTLLVSQVGLFSPNESIEELPTSSLKFLLLPAMLGELTSRRACLPPFPQNLCTASNGIPSNEYLSEMPDRFTILRLTKIYFEDFIIRCKEYGITHVELPKDKNSEEDNLSMSLGPRGGRPTPQQLHAMGQEREEKVRRFKEKKSLEDKLKQLSVSAREGDEEVLREYLLNKISHAIINCLEQLESIIMESSLLRQMKGRKQPPEGHQLEIRPKPSSSSFQPFLITRNAAQKAVYGMGYPSLPVMSVDEFYTKRVEEGWFPPGSSGGGACGSSSGGGGGSSVSSVVVEHGTAEAHQQERRPDDEQNSDDEDSQVKRRQLQERDEYRDSHRRGEGNTYNRS